MSPDQQRVVFADADGTLLRRNSLFEFLRFEAKLTNREHAADDFIKHLAYLRDQGTPREETNRLYYSWWSGYSASKLDEVGEKFSSSVDRQNWVSSIVKASVESLNYETLYILSASFRPALTLLLDSFPNAKIICTEPEILEGTLTGKIHRTMLGKDKADTVISILKEDGMSTVLPTTFGYGDHVTDRDFLELCDHQFVVCNHGIPDWAVRLGSYTILHQD